MSTTPKVYVACLACYNGGTLAGAWHDADAYLADAVDDWFGDHRETRPDHEEFAIHDHEGFGGLSIGEYDPLDTVGEIGEGIAEHGPAFAVYADIFGEPPTADDFAERYAGEWDSMTDFAENLVSERGMLATVPDEVARYFDYDAYARDLDQTHYSERVGGVLYVFRSC
jgi:antirestriction protein